MEDLMEQFTLYSNQALTDKSFDPSRIEHLMTLFDLESHKAWKSNEFELFKELSQAEFSLHEAEEYLDSVMESAMNEFGKFEFEFDRMGMDEMKSLEVSATETYDEAVAAAAVKSGKKKTMGACASTPKTLGDNVEKVPAPEQPKEETTTLTTEEVVVADKAVEEVKPEQEPKEEVKTAVATSKEQEKSLSSLLENTEEVKKETVEEPKETVAPAVEEKKEEATAAAAPAAEEEKKEEAPAAEPKKE